MRKLGRRLFLGNLLAGGAVLLAPRKARAADARVGVLINEPIGTIAPEIYSHFIEHLRASSTTECGSARSLRF
ncbi:MAG: hypothetical protein M3362_24615 [Acidobacteriota bacterium]|nr:hypothetical protein [Acidobacteriota bacterium]